MLHYKIGGSGRTVVFLHGFLESLTMWEVFDLETFPFRSLLIDLPGHGKSPLDKNYHDLREVAAEVKNTLNQLGVADFDIIGHSLGGYVALELHKMAPPGSKLMLYHSNFLEDDAQKKEDRNRVIEVVRKNKALFLNEAIPNLFLEEHRKSEFVLKLKEEAFAIDTEAIVLYSALMRDRPSNEAYAESLGHRLLFVQGERDKIVPNELILNKKDKIQVVFTPSGHMGHFEEKNTEFEIIRSFFGN